MREIFAGLPWWVKWIAVPVIALVVFGGLIASVVGFVIGGATAGPGPSRWPWRSWSGAPAASSTR
ncbi:DUF5326 family protein [Streptomyces cellulosae]